MAHAKLSGWSAKLSQTITLKDGRTLVTLSDARGCLITHFDTVLRSAALMHAIELLLSASRSSTKADCAAATEQLATVLRSRGLLLS